jgi:DNA polymerase III subunit beta
MKIVVEQGTFSKALKHVLGVIERRATIPVLRNVLLTATRDGLSLISTDLDIQVTETASATIEETGATTTPAQMLYDIVRELPDGSQISLETKKDGARLALSCGTAAFDLACMAKEEFPRMDAGDMVAEFDLAAADFLRMIDKTKMAMSTEQTRYYLCGIYLHVADRHTLRAVATDGHRLAQYDLPEPDGASTLPGIILPYKTVNEIRRMLDDATGAVHIAASDTKVKISVGQIQLLSKLVDGSFPDYQRVIPARGEHIATTLTSDLVKAINLVSVVMEGKTRAVKVSFTRDKATLSARETDSGTALKEINAEYDCADLETGFNSAYARDMLLQISGKSIRMIMQDAGSPIRFEDDEDDRFLHIIMPMRV